MEDLQRKHRQEQKEVQSRITQRKKSATKKTRKGVNDECTELERQLKERQASELAQFNAERHHGDEVSPAQTALEPMDETIQPEGVSKINEPMAAVSFTPEPLLNGHAKKPNRQKARQARRVAEQEAAVEQAEKEAADLPDLRETEIQVMREAYQSRGLMEREIRSDGHCLYSAVADQLKDSGLGLQPRIEFDVGSPLAADYMITRQVAAFYISSHSEDFIPFLEEPLEEYVKTIRETGEWGGHLEILALAKAYGVDINVLQGDGKVEKIEAGACGNRQPLWLAYYRHSYGLGEHYNSLRRAR